MLLKQDYIYMMKDLKIVRKHYKFIKIYAQRPEITIFLMYTHIYYKIFTKYHHSMISILFDFLGQRFTLIIILYL